MDFTTKTDLKIWYYSAYDSIELDDEHALVTWSLDIEQNESGIEAMFVHVRSVEIFATEKTLDDKGDTESERDLNLEFTPDNPDWKIKEDTSILFHQNEYGKIYPSAVDIDWKAKKITVEF